MRYASPDPLYAKFGPLSPWSHCAADPLNLIDEDGKETKLFATYLPDFNFRSRALQDANFPTHTFLVVSNDSRRDIYSFGSEIDGASGMFTGKLERLFYSQDRDVADGKRNDLIKKSFVINPPDGMTSEEFDSKVRAEAEKFAKENGQQYCVIPLTTDKGNCNTSTSTILLRAGVPKDEIERIKKLIPGVSIGFESKEWINNRNWITEETEESIQFQTLIRLYE